jgi:hypothetical protein
MAVLAALAVVLGIGVVTAPAASAGGCLVGGLLCGRVTNLDHRDIQIAKNWYPNMPASEKHVLHYGQYSGNIPGFSDTDAVWAPFSYYAQGNYYHAYVWYKITDLQHVYVP